MRSCADRLIAFLHGHEHRRIANPPIALTIPGPLPARLVGRHGNAIRLMADPVGHADRLFRQYGRIVSRAAGGGTNVYSPLPHCVGTAFAYGPDAVHAVISQHDVFAKHPLTGTFVVSATAWEVTRTGQRAIVAGRSLSRNVPGTV